MLLEKRKICKTSNYICDCIMLIIIFSILQNLVWKWFRCRKTVDFHGIEEIWIVAFDKSQ